MRIPASEGAAPASPGWRRQVASAGRWLAAGAFAALLISWALRADPLSLLPPRTVVTHAHPAIRTVEPYLTFLHELGRRLPPGASVLIIRGSGDPLMNFWIASGQLPANEVLAPNTPATNADFVASPGEPISLPGYRLVERWANGLLYRR